MKKIFPGDVEVSDTAFTASLRFAEAFGDPNNTESAEAVQAIKDLQTKFLNDNDNFDINDAQLLRLKVSRVFVLTELAQHEAFNDLNVKLNECVKNEGKLP
jgi:hypothetical protein